jgi:hypothetical protein
LLWRDGLKSEHFSLILFATSSSNAYNRYGEPPLKPNIFLENVFQLSHDLYTHPVRRPNIPPLKAFQPTTPRRRTHQQISTANPNSPLSDRNTRVKRRVNLRLSNRTQTENLDTLSPSLNCRFALDAIEKLNPLLRPFTQGPDLPHAIAKLRQAKFTLVMTSQILCNAIIELKKICGSDRDNFDPKSLAPNKKISAVAQLQNR